MAIVNVVCINSGNYQGQGIKYVNILHDMVRRNLPDNMFGTFTCFVDDVPETFTHEYNEGIQFVKLPGDLKGWWNKMWLFSRNLFPIGERVIYFDLDVVIVGALDDIFAYDGQFATLTDFYEPKIYNSSVMLWRAGFGHHIWEGFETAGRPRVAGGDQIAIWHQHRGAERLQELFPGAFVSFKQQARLVIPDGAKVVVFHGAPAPAEVKTGWVPRAWQLGGISVFDYKLYGNIEASEVLKNIRSALASPTPFIGGAMAAHKREAVVVGGGPSINNPDIIEEIRSRWQAGAVIVALNNAWRWLIAHNIYADYHVMLDARRENTAYVPPDVNTMQRFYSAQCSPLVLELSPSRKTKLWLPFYTDLPHTLGIEAVYFGGSSVGVAVLGLLKHLGFRTMRLFGYDSSYGAGGQHHGYKQTGNDGQAVINVEFEGQKYVSSPWMVAQAKEFRDMAAILVNDEGCEVSVHGVGLLPHMAYSLSKSIDPASIVKRGDVWWPAKDSECNAVTLQETLDIAPILEHVPRRDWCVQAGGNVGLWPKALKKHFKTVATFEPDALNFKCMSLNVPDVPGLQRHNAALSNTTGRGALKRDVGNCGSYYIDPVSSADEFPVVTIDSLNLPGLDLLQLDIEGSEYNALLGGEQTIRRYHPTVVVEEKALGQRFGVANDAIPCLMNTLGYIIAAHIGRDVVYTWQPHRSTPDE